MKKPSSVYLGTAGGSGALEGEEENDPAEHERQRHEDGDEFEEEEQSQHHAITSLPVPGGQLSVLQADALLLSPLFQQSVPSACLGQGHVLLARHRLMVGASVPRHLSHQRRHPVTQQ